MPYINQDERPWIDAGSLQPSTAGQLTYQLTKVITTYLRSDYKYADLAEVIAALENCKLEFYRRVVAPYEDAKCEENGDVYRTKKYDKPPRV
jgi:hypothetical protein